MWVSVLIVEWLDEDADALCYGSLPAVQAAMQREHAYTMDDGDMIAVESYWNEMNYYKKELDGSQGSWAGKLRICKAPQVKLPKVEVEL